jgi:hypothetical protein
MPLHEFCCLPLCCHTSRLSWCLSYKHIFYNYYRYKVKHLFKNNFQNPTPSEPILFCIISYVLTHWDLQTQFLSICLMFSLCSFWLISCCCLNIYKTNLKCPIYFQVAGRSAEECFNRMHADLSTPTPIAPRPRRCKAKFSPHGNFSLSDPELPNLLEPTIGRQTTWKQKNLAQKTVRHLLQKHCLIDQAQEADHFSIFESSPSALQLNISFEDSYGTPDSCMSSGSLHKRSTSSSAQKKPFSRLKNNQDESSPAVLKPVKNAILHEKYVDRLYRREGTKKCSYLRSN